MTIRKPAAEHGKRAAQPSATELYVDHLERTTGMYAMSAHEARQIVDRAAGSLTEALYETRRQSRDLK